MIGHSDSGTNRPCVLESLEPRLLLAGFVETIDNPYLPLIPGTTYLYQGVTEGQGTTEEMAVTDQTKVIQGVTTTVVRDRAYVGGQLVEDTLDWYAQDLVGNVWYFGEDAKQIDDGVVVGTEGSWEAGVNGAQPGIVMKAHPAWGNAYRQEFAQGVAEDRARVLGLGRKVTVPFGTFGNCLQTSDFSLLEPGTMELKYYAPGIGFIRSVMIRGGKDTLELAEVDIAPEGFAATIDNPYYPLVPGTTYIYQGTQEGTPARQEVTVTDQTKVIQGVTTTVIHDQAFLDGQLVEDTLDWYAQDKMGNVWYFGEDAKQIEDGVVVGTEGSWETGVDGAKPGIVMEAHPAVRDSYLQEHAQGVAEDRAAVLSLSRRVTVPFGTFGNCLQTSDFSLLEPGTMEQKYYAPGIGFVRSVMVKGGKEIMELAEVDIAPIGFATVIDNRYFPLMPGTTYIYQGTQNGQLAMQQVSVTDQTNVIQGVTTTVIHDQAFLDGQLVEDTLDWYAQDKMGNVWYFGEDAKQIDDGIVVGTEGSWQAGVNGAKPGIVMKAHPAVRDSYLQEHAQGVAEDRAAVLSLSRRVTVPFGTFGNCLQTWDFSLLEPGTMELKYYAPGIGFVRSVMTRGGREVVELVYILRA